MIQLSVSSSLELASKNIVCGSVKMVYALIYTLFLVQSISPLANHIVLLNFLTGFWSSNRIRFLPPLRP